MPKINSGNRQNVLFITADDMNYDSLGCYGCPTDSITPSIDDLAERGMRFTNAHVTIAVCMPSRETLMTGRYPHNNGGEGFEPISVEVPTLQEQLHASGYINGILGKTNHLAPSEKFCWDYKVNFDELGKGRDPERYYGYTKDFIERSKHEGKPFFLMANSHDPHRPFAGSDQEKRKWGDDPPEFGRRIEPDEVTVPGFLPDIPQVRLEIAEYYTSVHRCDETVGRVMAALEESGLYEDTLVMFISDNGMALPFAKTNCYLNSTKTPWIVSWPDRVEPGVIDDTHLISGVDYMPTILDALDIPFVNGMDGRSFLPMLYGRRQEGWEYVFTQFHETAANRRYPMRCVQSKGFGYIVNFWSDQETVFLNESQSGRTFAAMKSASESDPGILQRVHLFQYRVPEEFYNFGADPNALENLVDSSQYEREIADLRTVLGEWMHDTNDPAYDAFVNWGSEESLERFMDQQRQKARIARERKQRARESGRD